MSSFDVTAVLKANVGNFTSGIKEAQSVFEGFKVIPIGRLSQ